MKELVKTISGSSILISGTLLLNLVMSQMDWRRIGDYGLFNEFGKAGIAPLVFIITVILMIIGFIGIGTSTFNVEENKK